MPLMNTDIGQRYGLVERAKERGGRGEVQRRFWWKRWRCGREASSTHRMRIICDKEEETQGFGKNRNNEAARRQMQMRHTSQILTRGTHCSASVMKETHRRAVWVAVLSSSTECARSLLRCSVHIPWCTEAYAVVCLLRYPLRECPCTLSHAPLSTRSSLRERRLLRYDIKKEKEKI